MAPRLAPGVFHGTRMKMCVIGDFTVTEYAFTPNHSIARHSHEQTYLSLVLDGCWRETYGTQVRDRHPFSLTVHPAGELHSERLGRAGARAFHVEFSTPWLRHLEGYSTVLSRPAQVDCGPLTWHALRLVAEFRRIDPHSSLIFEGILLESVAALARCGAEDSERGIPPWLVRARDILRARFPERLSLAGIAREVGVHPLHLARSFRRHFSHSVGEYLREVRLRYACRELVRTERPLAEIALTAGFCDQSHLSRALRRFTGLTPAAFRRRAR